MNNVDSIYENIAEYLVQQITADWKECKVEVEFFGDAAEFDATYTNFEDKSFDLESGYYLFKEFQSLSTIMSDNPEIKWNKATFTLEPSGDFNIDFEWDQELADEIESYDH